MDGDRHSSWVGDCVEMSEVTRGPRAGLSAEDSARYLEAFNRLDHDGSGTLNANDIETLLSRLGMEVTRGEVEEFITEVDEDGNGEISYAEFVDMLTLHRNSVLAGVIDELILTEAQVAELQDVFNLFDRDRDGSITADELGSVLASLGMGPDQVDPDELSEMIAEVDDDGDGVISFDEFAIMMSRRMKDSDIESDVRTVFALFDPDSTGAADPQALMAVFASVGEVLERPDALKLIRAADVDADGLFTVDDLLDVMAIKKGTGSGLDLNSGSNLNLSGILNSTSSLAALGKR